MTSFKRKPTYVDEKKVRGLFEKYDLDKNGTLEKKEFKRIMGDILRVRAVVSLVPKKNIYSVVSLVDSIGLEVVDICYSSFGDYYALSNKSDDSLVGAIINIGEDSTNISVFNRGIQILLNYEKNLELVKAKDIMKKLSIYANEKDYNSMEDLMNELLNYCQSHF